MPRVCPTVPSEGDDEAELIEKDGEEMCSQCNMRVSGRNEFLRHTIEI